MSYCELRQEALTLWFQSRASIIHSPCLLLQLLLQGAPLVPRPSTRVRYLLHSHLEAAQLQFGEVKCADKTLVKMGAMMGSST